MTARITHLVWYSGDVLPALIGNYYLCLTKERNFILLRWCGTYWSEDWGVDEIMWWTDVEEKP